MTVTIVYHTYQIHPETSPRGCSSVRSGGIALDADRLMDTKVQVRNNAPNWPKMTETTQVKKRVGISSIPPAAASLWMPGSEPKIAQNEEKEPSPKWAPKKSIVRICQNCKLLYTNCHSC